MNLKKFFKELSRRNVIKETITYLIVAWVVIQVASIVLPVFDTPPWVFKSLVVFLITCIPLVIIFSWVYQITNKGIRKTDEIQDDPAYKVNKNRINAILIGSSVIAVALFIFLSIQIRKSVEYAPYSIAILPFKDINLDEENQTFLFGLREDIWQRLVRIDGIDIRSNRSAEAQEILSKPNKDIAALLNCRYLVDGSVSKIGDQIILNISIWDSNDKLIWQREYNETFEDIFKLQKNLSRSIVDVIKFKLNDEDERALEYTGTNNVEAFIKLKEGERKQLDNDEYGAIYQFESALRLDSTYADAFANLAYAYANLTWKFTVDHLNNVKKTKLYSKKALELDPDNGTALLALMVFYEVAGNDKALARQYLDRAAATMPNHPRLHYEKAANAKFSNPQDLENALFHYNKAIEIEPLEWQYVRELIQILSKLGRYEEALDVLKRTAFIFPKHRYPKALEFWTAELKRYQDGNRDAKLEFLKKEMELDRDNPFWPTEIGIHYDCYLNDDLNYLKYAEKAYELDTKLVDHYVNALSDNFKFDEAETMLNSEAFKNLRSEEKKDSVYFKFYSLKGDYESLKKLIDTTHLAKDSTNYIWYQAKAGLIKNLEDSEIKNYSFSIAGKATLYATLKNRDSMYHYLELPLIEAFLKRVPSVNPYLTIHSSHAFDPYRQEPRYKEFMKRHHLK